METDRVPPAPLQSEPEGTSPVHAVAEDTSGNIQPDPFSNPSQRNVVLRTTARIDPSTGNLGGPSAALSSTSSEKFHDTSSLQPLRSDNDHLAQRPSVRHSELNSGRRETKMNNDHAIDWIVPTEEKVSNVSYPQSESR